jgi:meso-butanediol dehydrogenase/(S,S)-butanediol dehydrogenase/diacetyl reductase
MSLQGKVALITGGGTGLGAAIARRYVQDGAKIVITGRRESKLDEMISTLPQGSVLKCAGDVANPDDIERMIETALSFGSSIQILVNCAGTNDFGSITDVRVEEWRHTLEVNVVAPFLIMKAVIPHMIKSGGGSIINISSVASLRYPTGLSAYCTSKAALNALTQQAAADYGVENIRCNAVCPGFFYTDMGLGGDMFPNIAKSLGIDIDTFLLNVFKDIPSRKPAYPEKLAGICSFLGSDDSSYITGDIIPVDGGLVTVDAFSAGVSRTVTELSLKDNNTIIK